MWKNLVAVIDRFAVPVSAGIVGWIVVSAVLSTVGVFAALLATGTTFNLSSFMGLIMVIGIVAKNGILLLDAEERFRREDVEFRMAPSAYRAAAGVDRAFEAGEFAPGNAWQVLVTRKGAS